VSSAAPRAPDDATPRAPRRVSVIGCSGAGKSTFARALAARLGVSHIEIDALFHGPNWTPAPDEVLRTRVAERIAAPGWVVDGNYRSRIGDLVRGSADTIAWLDPPRHVVMRSILARTLGRIVRRTELWNGNREHLRNLFDPRPEQNVVLWAWTHFAAYRSGYEKEAAAAPPGQQWHRFRSRDEAWAWLASLPAGG